MVTHPVLIMRAPSLLNPHPPPLSPAPFTPFLPLTPRTQLFSSDTQLLQLSSSLLRNNSAPSGGGCLWARIGGCAVLHDTRLSGCSSAAAAGGGAWVSLPSQQTLQGAPDGSATANGGSGDGWVGTGGCPKAVLQAAFPHLTASAQASLSPVLLAAALPANATPSSDYTPSPSSTPSSTPNSTSSSYYNAPSLLLAGMSVSGCSGTGGGAVALALLPGSLGLIDGLMATGNEAILGDGGGLSIATIPLIRCGRAGGRGRLPSSGTHQPDHQCHAHTLTCSPVRFPPSLPPLPRRSGTPVASGLIAVLDIFRSTLSANSAAWGRGGGVSVSSVSSTLPIQVGPQCVQPTSSTITWLYCSVQSCKV